MTWSKEWKAPIFPKEMIKQARMEVKEVTDLYGTEINPVALGVDLAKGEDKLNVVTMVDGKIVEIKEGDKARAFLDAVAHAEKVADEFPAIRTRSYDNLKPTHDPYTNPNAFLYYECDCGQRLDPHTKSFAGLNNAAMNSGWKIRWGANSYVPYCPKCVEEKGIE